MNKIASFLIAIIGTAVIFTACKKVDINNPPLPPVTHTVDHSITLQLAQVARVVKTADRLDEAQAPIIVKGRNIKVSWGDGVDSIYGGDANVTAIAYHTYPRMGDYTVTITGDSLTYLDCSGNNGTVAMTSTWLYSGDYSGEVSSGHVTSLLVNKVPEITYLKCIYNHIDVLSTSVVELPNLKRLFCAHNVRVGILPLTNCTLLDTVDCSYTSVSKLDLTNCQKLLYLNTTSPSSGVSGGYNLTSLKLNNPLLANLVCSASSLTSLDVTTCPALKTLDCSQNPFLTSLKLDNPILTTLRCGGDSKYGSPNLTTDFTKLPALTTLFFTYTTTAALPQGLEALTNLTGVLNCNNNAFTSIPDLTALTKLTSLKFGFNQITSVDASKIPGTVTFLDVSNNALTSLNVASLSKLSSLYCGTNPLTSLDFTSYPALGTLDCSYTPALTSLTLPTGSTASSLTVSSNNCGLTSLTVPSYTKTTTLNCSNNPLASITIPTTATGLKTLNCGSCQLTSLVLPALTGLQGLTLDNNPFDDVAGGVDVSKCASLGLNFNNVSIKNCPTAGTKFKTIYAALASTTTTSWAIDPSVTIVKK